MGETWQNKVDDVMEGYAGTVFDSFDKEEYQADPKGYLQQMYPQIYKKVKPKFDALWVEYQARDKKKKEEHAARIARQAKNARSQPANTKKQAGAKKKQQADADVSAREEDADVQGPSAKKAVKPKAVNLRLLGLDSPVNRREEPVAQGMQDRLDLEKQSKRQEREKLEQGRRLEKEVKKDRPRPTQARKAPARLSKPVADPKTPPSSADEDVIMEPVNQPTPARGKKMQHPNTQDINGKGEDEEEGMSDDRQPVLKKRKRNTTPEDPSDSELEILYPPPIKRAAKTQKYVDPIHNDDDDNDDDNDDDDDSQPSPTINPKGKAKGLRTRKKTVAEKLEAVKSTAAGGSKPDEEVAVAKTWVHLIQQDDKDLDELNIDVQRLLRRNSNLVEAGDLLIGDSRMPNWERNRDWGDENEDEDEF
ncbi:hypothetical protein CYLTODRAFT_480324 [Cylindrobasidium torrendii FP15055 ss-10]|uniref:Uncharacterized protein n=1 Tax=Cylindrobasidium torrendii FP15055 ss-10 TaxID=1314674 RepID=A0A0D7ARY3_9AGAR|nr:hypothetical protein CYLTODRAFT_480324 [Cylindrobasidium torrendii FP15055 ss-10]